jgi:hypothetical protein
MKRRELLRAGLAASWAGLLTGRGRAQEAGTTIHVHPTGADTNPGTKEKPLRTLADDAQRVNASSGVPLIRSEPGAYGLRRAVLLSESQVG